MRGQLPLLLLAVFLCGNTALAADWEKNVREHLCVGLRKEVPVEKRRGKGRPSAADCVTHEHAIEIDASDHWKEAIGQALYYASQLNKTAGLALVCKRKATSCQDDWYRVEAALTAARVRATVWFCLSPVQTLAECVREEYGLPSETPAERSP